MDDITLREELGGLEDLGDVDFVGGRFMVFERRLGVPGDFVGALLKILTSI